jgi:Ca2+-binding RTX toxin-like protein
MAVLVESLEDRTLLSVQFLFDYSYDTSGFFQDQSRRDTLSAAADSLGHRLDDSLQELTAGGANTWTASFIDPATGTGASEVDLVVPADTLYVFAGARDLVGMEVGQGGHGGFSASGDPVWLNRIGARGQDGALLPAPTDFGPWGGSIAFDSLTSWHFDPTTAVGAGEIDFFSVAVHELGHLLGISTGNGSWMGWIVESEFGGPASLAEYDGLGSVPLDGDNGHWAEGVTDGGQEVAMDPSLDSGERKPFTELDFSGLVDLGWAVLPETHTIDVAAGSGHTILIEDDPIASDSRSRVTIDGTTAVTFLHPADFLYINGADGDDTITLAGLDADFSARIVINGHNGDDTVSTGPGFGWAIEAHGGNGADSMIGGDGPDTLDGDSGEDVLVGGAGDDELNGGDAADHLSGGPGADILDGGAGDADTLLADGGDDSLDGGEGNDRVEVEGDTDFTLTDLALSGTDMLVLTGVEEVRITAGAGDNLLDATGFSGRVTLFGAGGADTLKGGAGNDLLIGNAGGDTLEGNGGADTLFGGSGGDWLDGGDGPDRLRGQGGSLDSLQGGAGDDSLDGGPGNDWAIAGGDVDLVLTDVSLSGDGADLLFFIERAEFVGGDLANTFDATAFTGNVTMFGGGGNDTLLGGGGNDLLNGNGGDDNLAAAGGADRVYGGAGNDWIAGGSGNDRLKGNGGNFDTLVGGSGNDLLHGGSGTGNRARESSEGNMVLIDGELSGAGTDQLQSIDIVELLGGPGPNRFNASAYAGNVILRGGGGNDTLQGGAGADLLVGNSGDDEIFGAGGADRIFGGSGTDSLSGGAGNDLLRGQAGDGDRLTGDGGDDLLRGGDGEDRVVESGDLDFVLTVASLVGRGNDSLIEIEGVELTGGTSGNVIDATATLLAVTLVGGEGNDTLRGGTVDDVLQGGAGDDLLDGGTGLDCVVGSGDVDWTLSNAALSGDGDDTLVSIERALLTAGPGDNLLDATAFSGQASLHGGLGNDTLRGGHGDDNLDGGGGNDRIAGNQGADRANGGSGNDVILGHGGNDTLLGGAGDDSILGGDGDDVVKGHGGNDRLCGGEGFNQVVGTAAEIDECFGDCFEDLCPDV